MQRTLESIILDASETEAVLRTNAIPFRLVRFRDGDLVISPSGEESFPEGWANATIRADKDGITVVVCGDAIAVKPKGAVFRNNVLTIECDGPAVEILYNEGENGLYRVDADTVDELWRLMNNAFAERIRPFACKGSDKRGPFMSCGIRLINSRIENGVAMPVRERFLVVGEREIPFNAGAVSVKGGAVLVDDGNDTWEVVFGVIGGNPVSEAVSKLSPFKEKQS